MALVDELRPGSCDFAQRFLQTAVVVDDEAYMPLAGGVQPQAGLVVPDRRTRASSRDSQGAVDRGSTHTLNAGSVMDAFSALGVICGVVGPTDSAMETMRQADIVILDWFLENGKPQLTLKLIRNLLTGEADRNSLRLLAIYTGEPGLNEVSAAVFEELKEARLDPAMDKTNTTISYRHGCVVLYAKSDVKLLENLKSRSVAEETLPGKLVEDFALMTSGLLPGIALTSLTAVREGAHKVLEQFSADLDPAFLAHRACLSDPQDAERQIVNHVAEELRGLMDNAVAEASPASAEAVESWIRRKGDGVATFVFGNRHLNLEETITLANKGLAASVLKNSAYEGLSAGFSGHSAVGLDARLAWNMSFRTVYNAPPPTLWLGTVVTVFQADGKQHLICMRPRCDCVRLDEETVFFFLPLVDPAAEMEQIVVSFDDEFKRLGIERNPGGWVLRKFKPSAESGTVTAAKRGPDCGFEFTDICDNQYKWRGELKTEYAQRIAQVFGSTLSRVAIDESEWLRRTAKTRR